MIDGLAFFPLLAPLALAGVAAVARRAPGSRPVAALAAARSAAVVGLMVAVAAAVTVATRGVVESPVLGVAGLGLSVRLDGLSVAMLALVAFLGAVVLEYSRNYLDGDPAQGRFLGRLALTVAAVMLLALSGNLLQLTAMWLLTSLALHRLLLFYADRPAAVVAARKKFIVARLGDVALAASALLLWHAFGTADIGLLLDRTTAAAPDGVGSDVHLAVMLLGAAAALKSAQFPTHGWLAEVMETPTPVSALLHAGLLNGGIFLIVRLAPVALLSPPALHAMIVVGGFTALFASVVMITQATVKGGLAYSSAAHMGFMMFLCGLGMYSIAIAHLIAHSCYKAHAFLSSGSIVEVRRASKVPGGRMTPGMLALASALGVAMTLVAGTGLLFGISLVSSPVFLGVGVILAIGLAQLLAQAKERAVAIRVGEAAVATAAAFFALEIASSHLLHAVVPTPVLRDPPTLALLLLVIAAFASASLFQLLLPRLASSPRVATAWVHVRNGLYANAVFDRLVGALHPIAPVHGKEVQ